MRAIRTKDYLYIKNFKPDRWPMGTPENMQGEQKATFEQLANRTQVTTTDLDASMTKAWMYTHLDVHALG